MTRLMLCSLLLGLALGTCCRADPPTAAELRARHAVQEEPEAAAPAVRHQPTAAELRARPGARAAAARGAAFTLDGFVGFYPRHSELKLGAALVLHNGAWVRPELQVAENVVGLGVGFKLPLSVFGAVLDISAGAGVDWDTSRHEWEGHAYLARVVF